MFRHSSRRRAALALVFLALIGSGLVIASLNRDSIEERLVEPAAVATPLPAQPQVSLEERALYQFFAPRLAALIAEADQLETLGRERSRNLVQLQVRSDRVAKLADDIDAYLAANVSPARLQPMIDRYRLAIEQVRAGMADSRAAITRFDWDGVASALDQFAGGVASLQVVLGDLQAAVSGDATPAPTAFGRQVAA